MRPTGLKSYDKKTKRAVFECIVPGTQSRKRLRKVITVKGWDDLREQLRIFRVGILHPEHNQTPVGDVPTLRAYCAQHWESYAARLSHEKRRSDEAIIEHHLLPLLGAVRIDRITTAHAEDVISAMRKKKHGGKPYANAYLNTILALLRGLLMHAYRRRVIQEPPFGRERLPLLPEPTVQNELTSDERDRFLASFDNEKGFRDHFANVVALNGKRPVFKRRSKYVTYYFERFQASKPLFTAALYTGLRFTDVRLLTWNSVDLKNGVIRLVMRKTQRPVTIPIAPRLRDALQECRGRTIVSEYVFLAPEGKPYSKATIMRYFRIAKAVAGITHRFRFHDQRHTFASILATNGINAFTLRDVLGHAQITTTTRYARPSTETFAAIRQALA